MSRDQRSYTYEEYLKTMKLFEENFGLKEVLESLDGGHYKHRGEHSRISLFNSNLKLLKYTPHLLKKYYSIITTGPHIHTRAGMIMEKNGEKNTRKMSITWTSTENNAQKHFLIKSTTQ